MREINLYVAALPAAPIPLYYQGEQDATVVRVHLSGWVSLFGEGTAKLLYQRPGDLAPYTPEGTSQQDGVLTWVVSSADIQQPGIGKIQLEYTTDAGTVARSPILRTHCSGSLGQETDPPTAERPWYDQAMDAANRAEAAADRAEDAADRAEAAAEGGGGGTSNLLWRPTVSEDGEISWEQSASDTPPEPVNIMGPQGPAGADGETGPAGLGVPAVTAADNGKFLRVVDGTWAAAEVDNAEEAGF